MTLVILAVSILLLLILIGRFKINAFLALLLVALFAGILSGMSPTAALHSMLKGVGDTMGSVALVIIFGAILGKMIEESGAAHSITNALVDRLGEARMQAAVAVTGFLVGLPMMYNASFLVLIPLIYTISATRNIPLMWIGIPLSSALSVTHGYLPPHPAPMAVAAMYKADPNLTLLYGLVPALPGAILAGPVLARFFRHMRNTPPPSLYTPREFRPEQLPGVALSVFTTLVPVLLMLAGALVSLLALKGTAAGILLFASDPTIALLTAALVSFYTLGIRRGRSMESVMQSVNTAVAGVAMIILIIACGGAFKQVLLDAGASEGIKAFTAQLKISPIITGWCVAALIRIAVGSATVAAITAGGVVAPLLAGSGVSPELVTLATTSGSLMFSHVNDIGFWMFKEYYNVSVRQTFAIWTVMETIVAIVGLAGALALGLFIRA